MNVKSGTVIINFANINVNYVNNTSSIVMGNNFMCNWTTSMKINNGIGDISGRNNVVTLCQSTVIDPDYVDYPILLTQSV